MGPPQKLAGGGPFYGNGKTVPHRASRPRAAARSEVTVSRIAASACGDARGLHESIAKRTGSALGRVRAMSPLVFAGGVANNEAMVELIRSGFQGEAIVPESAQTVGALGAALSFDSGGALILAHARRGRHTLREMGGDSSGPVLSEAA
jgi:predicted NodU family carbamoyl transferase